MIKCFIECDCKLCIKKQWLWSIECTRDPSSIIMVMFLCMLRTQASTKPPWKKKTKVATIAASNTSIVFIGTGNNQQDLLYNVVVKTKRSFTTCVEPCNIKPVALTEHKMLLQEGVTGAMTPRLARLWPANYQHVGCKDCNFDIITCHCDVSQRVSLLQSTAFTHAFSRSIVLRYNYPLRVVQLSVIQRVNYSSM